ncbi:hypothetical protein [Nocardiopsis tropica]|uniref:MFS transporter n=1 Tax=Nocardiopsis tropica TaxID=109330 RepID=A0ABU7KN43_9ACTN|nr:hypothetical protein [Nocardiopsis umidischolae]MEE2050097.1 hypothetical protein [Nocardiopsis umidischolae]
MTNRGFVVFTVAMAGSYVLNFQVYLALPLTVQNAVEAAGFGVDSGHIAVAALFAVSALVAIAGQVRLTDWANAAGTPRRRCRAV